MRRLLPLIWKVWRFIICTDTLEKVQTNRPFAKVYIKCEANKLWNWGTKQLVLGENIQLIWLFSGGQRRHTSVLLSESCSAVTVGSFIMQDVLIITHHHVFRATWWRADSHIYKPLRIHTKQQECHSECLETTGKWIYSCVRNSHAANLKKKKFISHKAWMLVKY